MGLALFFVAREFGLVTAAVGGAAAGVLLWGLQKVVKIDLLGGLAVFGIALSLVAAAFALLIQDERIIQYRGTILSIIGAVPFLADGLLAKGEKLASRLARYLQFPVDHPKLGLAMRLIGLISAALNATAASLLSPEHWLVFTTFLDAPVLLGLFLVSLVWVAQGSNVCSLSEPGPVTASRNSAPQQVQLDAEGVDRDAI